MTTIKLLADITLPNLAAAFSTPFTLTTYQTNEQLTALLPSHDVLICRSTLKVDKTLLKYSHLQGVATASSGVDHIDQSYIDKHNIALFDAKGCNAIAVADYVVSTLGWLDKNHLLTGKKAGVIGVGFVGSLVIGRLQAAGFEVICFDPLLSTRNPAHRYGALDELATCDLICIHANWHQQAPFPSHHLLSTDFFLKVKQGVTLINASRGNIVDEAALLQSNCAITYCTDVYANEPNIDSRIIDYATLCTPHIAGHSIEAKQNAITCISKKLYAHYHVDRLEEKTTHHLFDTLPRSNWQACVLDLYDPSIDTKRLKAAQNKRQAFLTQRQAHQARHDYSCYDAHLFPKKTKALLGN